jgi:hypothetical protein
MKPNGSITTGIEKWLRYTGSQFGLHRLRLVLSEKLPFRNQSAEIPQPLPRNSRHLLGKLQQQAGSGAVGEDLYLGGLFLRLKGMGYPTSATMAGSILGRNTKRS